MVDLRINVIYGIQVVSNYPARNFALRLGFREVGILPKYHYIDGRLEDARVLMLVDEDYLPGFYRWKEAQPKVTP
jgi:RimJ/RimL family protein N-acetyltransferase